MKRISRFFALHSLLLPTLLMSSGGSLAYAGLPQGLSEAGVSEEAYQSLQSILSKSKEPGAILRGFQGPAGFVGLIIGQPDKPDDQIIAWATVDGRYIFAGNIIDWNGRNLTDLAADHYRVKNPIAVAMHRVVAETISRMMQSSGKSPEDQPPVDAKAAMDQSLSAINQGAGPTFTFGTPNTDMVIYVDPLCGHCQEFMIGFFDAMQRTMAQKKPKNVRVHIIPVALFGEKSPAGALVTAKTPAAAQAIFQDAKLGKQVEQKPSETALKRVEQNSDLMRALNIPGTPWVVLRAKDGALKSLFGPSHQEIIEAIP